MWWEGGFWNVDNFTLGITLANKHRVLHRIKNKNKNEESEISSEKKCTLVNECNYKV